jgi:hypothetical protein
VDSPPKVPCPCGCGAHLPPPLQYVGRIVSAAIEAWVEEQGLTMAQLRSADRSADMVEARRRVARYLRHHGWSLPSIGRFIDRDHTTVMHLLAGKPAA